MVSFSNIRYSQAWQIGLKQEKLMEKIMEVPNIEQKWDSVEVETMMLDLID
jgi:kynurenine 3-monooxygenase